MRLDDDTAFVIHMRGLGLLTLGAGVIGIIIAAVLASERQPGASLAIALGSSSLILGAAYLLRGMR
jgi:hypothetical protein